MSHWHQHATSVHCIALPHACITLQRLCRHAPPQSLHAAAPAAWRRRLRVPPANCRRHHRIHTSTHSNHHANVQRQTPSKEKEFYPHHMVTCHILSHYIQWCKKWGCLASSTALNTYSVLMTPGVILGNCRCIHCAVPLRVGPTVAGLCGNDRALNFHQSFF